MIRYVNENELSNQICINMNIAEKSDLSSLSVIVLQTADSPFTHLVPYLEEFGCKITVQRNLNSVREDMQKRTSNLLLIDLGSLDQESESFFKWLSKKKNALYCPVICVLNEDKNLKILEKIENQVIDFISPSASKNILEARIRFCLNRQKHLFKMHKLCYALQEVRKYFEESIEGLETGFALFDSTHNLLLSNSKFKRLYDLEEDVDTRQVTLETFLHSSYQKQVYARSRRRNEGSSDNPELAGFENWLNLRMHQYRKFRSYVEQFRDGRWVEVSNNSTVEGGLVSLHKDVTAHKNAERHLEYLAWHDPLTGLVNRSLFEAKLKAIFSTHPRTARQFAILYLDIDDFKTVNDRWGHDFGDALLKVSAQRLQYALREGDTTARIGGDEFAVLLPDFESSQDVAEVAKRVIESFSQDFMYENQPISIGVSIGIVICPDAAEDVTSCLRRADIAMYKAKNAGKSQYAFFDPSDLLDVKEEL